MAESPEDDERVAVEVAESESQRNSTPSVKLTRSRSRLQMEMADWSPLRVKMHGILSSHAFDMVMGGIIASNVVLMLIEADHRAKYYPSEYQGAAIEWLNRLLLLIYLVEACARGFVDRRKYFLSAWNCLDFFIVFVGVLDEILMIASGGEELIPNVIPLMRILRIARLLRAVRLLRFFPELYIMIRGFLGAMKAMFWGLTLIICLLLLWALICVEVLHPINHGMVEDLRASDPDSVNEYCAVAFSSIFKAMTLYFQTLVAGDSWGACALPLIEYSPGTFIIFALSLVSVSLGFMNLILAVIVDNATAAREGDKEEMMKEKKKGEEAALKKWKDVIKQIDADESGTITMEELMGGYDEVPEVRDTMDLMGVERDDLEVMFKLMDDDNSGDLGYDEFIDEFLKAQGQDLRIYLMMTKLQMDSVAKTSKRMARELDALRGGPAAAAAVQQPPAWSAAKQSPALEAASFEADFQRMSAQIQAQFKALSWSIEQNTAAVAAAAQAGPADAAQRRGEPQASEPLLGAAQKPLDDQVLRATLAADSGGGATDRALSRCSEISEGANMVRVKV